VKEKKKIMILGGGKDKLIFENYLTAKKMIKLIIENGEELL